MRVASKIFGGFGVWGFRFRVSNFGEDDPADLGFRCRICLRVVGIGLKVRQGLVNPKASAKHPYRTEPYL